MGHDPIKELDSKVLELSKHNFEQVYDTKVIENARNICSKDYADKPSTVRN